MGHAGGAVGGGDVGHDEPPAERVAAFSRASRSSTTPGVGEHDVDAQVGRVLPEHLQVLLRGEVVGLTGLRRQVERDQPPGLVDSCSAAASSGTLRCGSTLVNHDPGPNTSQSASQHGATASGHAGGSSGTSEMACTRPGVSAQATCPRTVEMTPVELHLGHDVQRHRRHRQHPAVGAEQPADPVEARRRGRRAAPTARR